jgi:hypothetical protein
MVFALNKGELECLANLPHKGGRRANPIKG